MVVQECEQLAHKGKIRVLPQCAHSEPDPKLLLFSHGRNQCLIFHAFWEVVKSFMGTNFWQKLFSKALAKKFMVEFCNGK